ncbi:MAG: hypothetical protein ACXVPL_01160 [Actinomycetota bacterium]
MDDGTMRDGARTETSAGRSDTTTAERSETSTAVEDAFVKVPDTGNGATKPTAGSAGEREQLLDHDRAASFRGRWDDIQTNFVDRPRESVEQADRLVLEVVQQVQARFTLARERLESQWSDGGGASTEDLRQALRRYREFFDRLLNA